MGGFGGTIKLEGESEYRKALSEITQSLKVVSAEMRATSTGFEAGNVSAKNTIATANELKTSLESQGTALAQLKAELATMQAEYAKTAASHNALLSEYDAERAKLDEIKNTLGTSSSEYQNQEKIVTDLATEVQNSTKSYDAQTKAMNDMEIKTAGAEETYNKTAKSLNDMGEAAKNGGKKAQESTQGWTVLKEVLANLATQAITAAWNGIKKLGQGFVDVGKQALESYGNYEQLQGGIKKLFGEEFAQQVIDNANNAFSTAGLSANQYMETVTSFSASLLSAVGEDTGKAVEYADMAIRDMSDNANTFGTDMSSIQAAYQGFAKGNYTMLDNLKLGYAGTKEGMVQLVKESGVLGAASKDLTVKNFDQMVSFADIVKAIHVTQENYRITGTTAAEAAGTIQGSTNTMKAAWANMLTGIADENANFTTLASNFIESVVAVAQNIVPRISTVISGLADAISTSVPALLKQIVPLITAEIPNLVAAVNTLIKSILDCLPQIMPVISALIPEIASTIVKLLPTIIEAGGKILLSLIDGITKAIPQLVAMLPQVITSIINTITKLLPQIIQAGINLLLALVEGILKAIPEMVQKLPEIINNIISTLVGMIPQIVDCGVKLLTALVQNLPAIIKGVCDALPELIKAIVGGIGDLIPQIVDAGVTLLVALVQNLPAIIAGVVAAVPDIISALVKGIGEGVSQMAQVGLELIQGLWNGISDAASWLWGKVKGFCDDLLDNILDFFGIGSPSKVFADEVGTNLATGIGMGFSDTMKDVAKDMNSAIPTSFDMDASINGTHANHGTGSAYYDMVSAFKDALYQVKIELDDEVAGRFVDRTVARAIFN